MTSRGSIPESEAPAAKLSGSERRARLRAASGVASSARLREATSRSLAVERAPRPASRIASAGAIFVSYSRQDVIVVRPLVDRLRKGGAHVVWDQDFPAGCDFELRIRASIDDAAAVIAVWSAASAISPFVRDEAKRAARGNKLIPTHVAGFDVSETPLGLGHLNVIPLDDFEWLCSSLGQLGIDLDDKS